MASGFLWLSYSAAKAQNEYLNLIENEFFFNPDNLTDDWMMDYIIDSEIQLKSYSVTEHFRIRSIASSSYKFGAEEMKRRFRISAKNRKIKLSFLTQKDHQTAGVEIDPVPGRIKMLFGDFGFSHGLGLVFSSKRRFNSWLQNPHQQLYRAGGFGVNSSSDSSRFLRGAGISYRFRKLKLQAFFGERGDGLFLNYKADKVHLGFGLSSFKHKNQSYIRIGPFVKWRLGGGILYGELALQNNKGNAFEIGYSFFGNERQSFIVKYLYYSSGIIPHFSVLDFTKVAAADQRSIGLNYKWEWRANWFLHVDVQSESGLMLPDRGLSPKEDWTFKIGIIRHSYSADQFVSRIVGSDLGVRAMARWRIGLGERKSFIQFESGWSRKNVKDLNYPQNLYFAFDMCQRSLFKKWVVNTGISMHQSTDKSIPLYRYEPDLFYSMSIPVLSGSGMRGYLKLRYNLREDLQVEFKYNRSLSYGSINGAASNQVKLQIIYSPELKFGSS